MDPEVGYDSDATIADDVSRAGSPLRQVTAEESDGGDGEDEEEIEVLNSASEREEEPEAELVNIEEAAAGPQAEQGSSQQEKLSSNQNTDDQCAKSGGFKRPADSDNEDNEDDGSLCPICLDSWSNSGSHRLASLKCGHFFGNNCIVKWLQVACTAAQRRCPQCNKKATIKDIRLHYARKMQVLDTTERDKVQQHLEKVKQEKTLLSLELARTKLTCQLQQKKIEELQRRLEGHPQGIRPMTQKPSQPISHYTMAHNIEICKDGGCRVLTHNAWLNLLIVSQRSANNLFSGFGIRKVDAVNFRPTQFLFLHPKEIRDLAFSPHQHDLLLSVGMDQTAKLLNVTSNSVVQTYMTNSRLWSCCWDADNPFVFFTGLSNGVIVQYDTRYPNHSLSQLAVEDSSPVTALAPVPSCAGRTLSRGGFLACRLNSCWGYEKEGDDHQGTQLPFDGPFVSLSYNQSTDHVLISTRPSARTPHARHMFCQMNQITAGEQPALVCSPLHIFQGSTSQNLMSRSCQMTVNNDTLVAAHQESRSCITMWSASSGQGVLNIPSADAVKDLCPVQGNNTQYLAALSEKKLRIYSVT